MVDALEIGPSKFDSSPELDVSSTELPGAIDPATYCPWDEVSVAVDAIEYDP